MDIQVVLTGSDPKLGARGQILKVSSGYAQNFLIPQKKAILATAANLKNFENEKTKAAKVEAESLNRAKEIAEKILSSSLTLDMSSGEGDKLYGAVTSQDIVQGLVKLGVVIERKDIHLEEPIKKLGEYQVTVKLHREVSAALKLWVVKKK